MAIRVVRENGDEILRKKSREVEKVDDKIREILDDMVETLHKYNGVGLAGPQIGILKRIIVIDLYDDKGPIKLINPVIIKEYTSVISLSVTIAPATKTVAIIPIAMQTWTILLPFHSSTHL